MREEALIITLGLSFEVIAHFVLMALTMWGFLPSEEKFAIGCPFVRCLWITREGFKYIIDDSNHSSIGVGYSVAHLQELRLIFVEDCQRAHYFRCSLRAAFTTVEAHNVFEEIGISTVVLPLQLIDLAAQVLLQLREILRLAVLLEPAEEGEDGGCGQAIELTMR